ncbi:MAG: exodeoxyribonuclease V subunit beta [Betaproteobacteria bacterium]|nr:exodeoxyribonuclease V subunit beta [Betaproteobacteria bacterium]
MNRDAPLLDPLAFPLAGSRLIEASAGTGKTFTIAALYVRLVLGLGGPQDFPGGPLTPPQILVVTFTEAATRELRDRVRARLAQAARWFGAGADCPDASAPDDFLRGLRTGIAAPLWPDCARRLQLAAEWMDEAAISTIHAWCNRMLREHAFASRSLFNQTLDTDPAALRAEVVRDYWRNHYYPLAADDFASVAACWSDPAVLEMDVAGLLADAELLPAAPPPSELLAALRRELTPLKAPWAAWADELEALLDAAVARGEVNGSKLKRTHYAEWLARLRNWANDPGLAPPDLSEAAWKRLSPDGLADAWRSGTPTQHPAPAALAVLRLALATLPQPRPGFLAHAAATIAADFAAARRRKASMGFDDLLTGLDAALAGPSGERLAVTIRGQFPVALIDEFQDTDPVQYHIFARIYDIAADRPDHALILIGDPKQAIYAFRGADIHTYLAVRRAVAGRLHTLGTNFRSTPAMVVAANHCFAGAETAADRPGAFRFRTGDDNPVPFRAVAAHGPPWELVVENGPVAALTAAVIAHAPDGLTKEQYLADSAAACATRIVAWLDGGRRGMTGLRHADGRFAPLRPGDVAVLVANRDEAAAIRSALAARGVRTVYLSDRDSIFQAGAAGEVQHWLAACAAPDNERLLRAALATPALGVAFSELDTLAGNDEAWEARVIQFKGYRETWMRRGVLPMLRRLLFDFSVPGRLIAAGDERTLTDFLHLAELLQQASMGLDGEHALIRWFAEERAAPPGEDDTRRLRLESDADLVQVVTIHKAKGLEYPLVFLPFASTAMAAKGDKPLRWHDSAGDRRLALVPDAAVLAVAEEERLAEDIRKIYVALTRARYATWVGLAPLKGAAPSAIAYLFGCDDGDPAGFAGRIAAFSAGCPDITVDTAPAVNADRFRPAAVAAVAGSARRPRRTTGDGWRIASYSALAVATQAEAPESDDDTARAGNLQEPLRDVLPAHGGGSAPHRFPRGAEAGTFLHELLEWAAAQGFAATLADPAALRAEVVRRCRQRHWDKWADSLYDWLLALVRTPLALPDNGAFRLADLTEYRAELEFAFAASDADLARLDTAVVRHTLGGQARPRLRPDTLNGLLKGFIDLVFVHEGRYYVADYKSNRLGDGDEAYASANLDAAIRAHRYDLQYALYLFALHRLLKARLPGYEYGRHVGGAAYLFLRGVAAPGAGLHFERPPAALIDEMEAIFGKDGR